MSRHHGDARLDHLVLLLRALAKTDWHRFYFQSALAELREPWTQPRGAERDDFDVQSFSLMLDEASWRCRGSRPAAFELPDGGQGVRYMAVLIGIWSGHGRWQPPSSIFWKGTPKLKAESI